MEIDITKLTILSRSICLSRYALELAMEYEYMFSAMDGYDGIVLRFQVSHYKSDSMSVEPITDGLEYPKDHAYMVSSGMGEVIDIQIGSNQHLANYIVTENKMEYFAMKTKEFSIKVPMYALLLVIGRVGGQALISPVNETIPLPEEGGKEFSMSDTLKLNDYQPQSIAEMH